MLLLVFFLFFFSFFCWLIYWQSAEIVCLGSYNTSNSTRPPVAAVVAAAAGGIRTAKVKGQKRQQLQLIHWPLPQPYYGFNRVFGRTCRRAGLMPISVWQIKQQQKLKRFITPTQRRLKRRNAGNMLHLIGNMLRATCVHRPEPWLADV